MKMVNGNSVAPPTPPPWRDAAAIRSLAMEMDAYADSARRLIEPTRHTPKEPGAEEVGATISDILIMIGKLHQTMRYSPDAFVDGDACNPYLSETQLAEIILKLMCAASFWQMNLHDAMEYLVRDMAKEVGNVAAL